LKILVLQAEPQELEVIQKALHSFAQVDPAQDESVVQLQLRRGCYDCVLAREDHAQRWRLPEPMATPVLLWNQLTTGLWLQLRALATAFRRQKRRRRKARRELLLEQKARIDAERELALLRVQATRTERRARELQELYDSAPVGFITVNRLGQIERVNSAAVIMLGGVARDLLGAPLVALSPPDQADRLLTQLWRCFRGEPDDSWEMRLRSGDSEIRTVQVTGIRMFQGSVAKVHLAFTDISKEIRMRQSNQLMQGVLQGVSDNLEDGVLTGNSEGNVKTANAAAIRMLGLSLEQLSSRKLRTLFAPSNPSLSSRQRVLFHQEGGSTFHAEVRFLEVRVEQRVQSILLVRDVTEAGRLRDEAVEGRELERRRLGRNLHEGLAQDLAAIGFIAEALQAKLAGQTLEGLANRVAELGKLLVNKTRAMAQRMYPQLLDQRGLSEALLDLVTGTVATAEVECDLEVQHVEIPRQLALPLFRIAQEALVNVVAHADASRIEVRLRAEGEWVHLLVGDNGRGFPEGVGHATGTGLRTMRLYSEAISGILEIETRSEGTRVSCSAPREQLVQQSVSGF
jgi:two-component system sensor kinase FixL